MMKGTAALAHLLAVTLPVVITVSFNSGAPHYIANHQDAEPVEMCDWLSSCASPAWHDGNRTLRCTWRNGTEANATVTEEGSDPASLPGHNGTDVPPECPSVDPRAGPDVLRIVGGLVFPVPAAVSTCCLISMCFKKPSRNVCDIMFASSTLASTCCFLLMVLYAVRPVIEAPGWDVAIRSPCMWVAVRTYFALSTTTGWCVHNVDDDALLASLLLLSLWLLFLFLSTVTSPVAAAHRILSTGEWGFAISSAAIYCIAWPVWWMIIKGPALAKGCFLLFGPGAFAVLTAIYFGATPTHTPLTSYWLPLGNPDMLGFWSVSSFVYIPFLFDFNGVIPPPWDVHTRNTADALEMEAASSSSEAGCGSCGEDSDEDELEEEEQDEEEEGAGGSEAADGDAGDGMPLSLRLPTGDVAVVCVAESASLGDLRRRALHEVLSAASGGRGDGTVWRVHLTSGGVRLRGPAHTPLHTLTLESGSVVEVCTEAAPIHPASASEAQSELLVAVREGDEARTAELLRSQGRYPDMLHNSEGVFDEEAYDRILLGATSNVLHTLLRKARPANACSVLLVFTDRPRFPALARHSGVLRRPAVMACVAEKAEPWVLYRLQLCTRRDLGFGVSMEEAVAAYARQPWVPMTSHTLCATLRSWGLDVRHVPPAARSAHFGKEPPLWVPCLPPSSHPFSAVLLASGVPLSEVPHAVTALPVVCAYTAVCALCVVGVAYLHAAFQMVDDSAWMTVVFVAVSGPFFLFDLLPDWVQCRLVRRTQSCIQRWWCRHSPGPTEPPPELQRGLMQA